MQQVWECLAVLAAVGMCEQLWNVSRVVLQMRADNVIALTLIVKMRPGSLAIDIVARELALRVVELSFPPDAIHTLGFSHVIADRLSRVYSPVGDGVVDASIHPALGNAIRTVPDRNEEWYKAYKRVPAYTTEAV